MVIKFDVQHTRYVYTWWFKSEGPGQDELVQQTVLYVSAIDIRRGIYGMGADEGDCRFVNIVRSRGVSDMARASQNRSSTVSRAW